MICDFCKSEILFLKEEGDKTGLYCKSCGRWLKWVGASEKAAVETQIEKLKREVRLDGRDVERVFEKYKKYKGKAKELQEEIAFYHSMKTKPTSEMEKNAMYAKVLKLKELMAEIAAYDEIIMTLGLKSTL